MPRITNGITAGQHASSHFGVAIAQRMEIVIVILESNVKVDLFPTLSTRNPKNGDLYWTVRTGGMNSSSRPIYRHGMVYVFCGMGSMSAIRPGG